MILCCQQGIVSTWLFTGPPRFHKASVVNLIFAIGTSVSCAGIVLYLYKKNIAKRAEVARLLREEGEGTQPGGWNSDKVRSTLGDRHPLFKFTL